MRCKRKVWCVQYHIFSAENDHPGTAFVASPVRTVARTVARRARQAAAVHHYDYCRPPDSVELMLTINSAIDTDEALLNGAGWGVLIHPSSRSKEVISADPAVISSEEAFVAVGLLGKSIL